MKIPILLLAFILSIHSPTYARMLTTPPLPNDTHETIAIIVLQNQESEQEIKQFLARFKDIQLRHIFHEAINGFSVQGPADSIAQLGRQKQILSVSPVAKYQAEAEEGVKIIGGEEVRKFFDKKNNRLTGKGVTVGVIDTGVDYTHPDLRRNYAGGRDLVDGDRDPMETRASGKATLHGTHVAGIIAGNGKIQGVAPEARIIAYRALGRAAAGQRSRCWQRLSRRLRIKLISSIFRLAMISTDLTFRLASR
ncbi:S8 family serine peptidase [Neobacillus pocheonensis]|uniref:S8 family serine peptidase n=1 Tax=Neobacillus pocheonensis TaxID=363869 RepID=A0ABT0WHD4_9BACI|nr:S8 family serine peptidase [Neobacillus pocheonensis]